MGRSDVLLFVALARDVERREGMFNAKDLSSMAWAFATVGRLEALLFAILVRMMEQRMNEFNKADIVMTV